MPQNHFRAKVEINSTLEYEIKCDSLSEVERFIQVDIATRMNLQYLHPHQITSCKIESVISDFEEELIAPITHIEVTAKTESNQCYTQSAITA